MTAKGVKQMSIIIAVCALVGALVISYEIPPYHLLSTVRIARQPSDDPTIPAGREETR